MRNLPANKSEKLLLPAQGPSKSTYIYLFTWPARGKTACRCYMGRVRRIRFKFWGLLIKIYGELKIKVRIFYTGRRVYARKCCYILIKVPRSLYFISSGAGLLLIKISFRSQNGECFNPFLSFGPTAECCAGENGVVCRLQ